MKCWTVRRDSYICLCEMSRLNVYARDHMRPILIIMLAVLLCAGCSGNNENAHTTATTVVPPPPRQVLRPEFHEASPRPINRDALQGRKYDGEKPILFFHMPNGLKLREDQPL